MFTTDLSDILPAANDEFIKGIGFYRNFLLETDRHHARLDLFYAGPLEPGVDSVDINNRAL